MTTNLFVIANVKQLRTGGSFRILLPFFPNMCWSVGVINSTIFNSFHNRVEFGGPSEFRGGGWTLPIPPPPRYATALIRLSTKWNYSHDDTCITHHYFLKHAAASPNMNNENTFFNDKSTSGGKTTNLPLVERPQIYLRWKDHKSTSGGKITNLPLVERPQIYLWCKDHKPTGVPGSRSHHTETTSSSFCISDHFWEIINLSSYSRL